MSQKKAPRMRTGGSVHASHFAPPIQPAPPKKTAPAAAMAVSEQCAHTRARPTGVHHFLRWGSIDNRPCARLPLERWGGNRVLLTDGPGSIGVAMPEREAPSRSKSNYFVLGAILVAAVVVFVAFNNGADPLAGANADPFHVETSPNFGGDEYNVTLVAFESPQCSSCRLFHHGTGNGQPSTFERLSADFFEVGKVRYVEKAMFIGYPWERAAANAQKCVWHEAPDSFFDLTQAIYRDQTKINSGNLETWLSSWATGAGVDAKKIVSCTQAKTYADEVAQDLKDAQLAGVSGTPTFIVVAADGQTQRIVGPQSYETFVQAIENARS